jgi:hypothetical protein
MTTSQWIMLFFNEKYFWAPNQNAKTTFMLENAGCKHDKNSALQVARAQLAGKPRQLPTPGQ